jgi:hypothetical protein
MSGFKTIDGITERIPLNRCNMEEIAAYQRSAEPSGGVLFARTKGEQRREKSTARQLIIDLLKPDVWSHNLTILTMPGIEWEFERNLIGWREGKWAHRLEAPTRTNIWSIENDRAIYFAAIDKMPGRLTFNALLSVGKAPYFAVHSVKTKFVKGFYLANVDKLMEEALRDLNPRHYHVVWLDYTGPLSIARLKTIAAFYERIVDQILIVTALKARWDRDTSAAVERAGGHSQWLRKHLEGTILHDIEYQDTVPMAQFAVRKQRGLWAWEILNS